MVRDLNELGHSFNYLKVDANRYLLPQRRNRVFGCSFVRGEQSVPEIVGQQEKWKSVFGKLGLGNKSQQLTLDDVIEPGIPARPLQAPQDLKNWDLICAKLKQSKISPTSLCMHMGASETRLEYNVGASTCVRPSHEIFCNLIGRPFIGCELLRLQGSFAADYSNPKAVEDLGEQLAKDLAGNAFPTTVLQANVIASMVSHAAWRQIAEAEGPGSLPKSTGEKQSNQSKRGRRKAPPGPADEQQNQKKQKNRKRPSGDEKLGRIG